MASLSALFSWRSAICDTDLPAPVKQVALTLSLHMSERGDSAFPKVMTLVAETSLSERTVRAALKTLCEQGWLQGEKRHRQDGSHTSTEYRATVGGGAPPAPPPCTSCTTPGAPPAPQEDVPSEGVIEVVPPVAPQSIVKLDDHHFDAWWSFYPRKVAKPAAAKAYKAALKKATAVELLDGLTRWNEYWTARGQPEYIAHPSTWLNQERWNDCPPALTAQRPKLSQGGEAWMRSRQRSLARRQEEQS